MVGAGDAGCFGALLFVDSSRFMVRTDHVRSKRSTCRRFFAGPVVAPPTGSMHASWRISYCTQTFIILYLLVGLSTPVGRPLCVRCEFWVGAGGHWV